MYKLIKPVFGTESKSVLRLNDYAQIPFNLDNTDYQTFKKEINEGTAQLEDADGNLMTEQEAKDFVATLP